MAITLLETKDHSHTLYVPELDETYHSRNGAIEEAVYVYIGKGLGDWLGARWLSSFGSAQDDTFAETETFQQTENSKLTTVNILEIGFGTGLNAWLTAMECGKQNIHCHYHSLETFLLDAALVSQLNYTSQNSAQEQQLFKSIHEAEWNIAIKINDHFTLQKEQVSLQAYAPQTSFDVIYFDAFAPEKQPELWTEELFRKLYNTLNPGGVIVTYSCKGTIRRMWQEIGFEVERLPGPPMKRHMLRGRRGM